MTGAPQAKLPWASRVRHADVTAVVVVSQDRCARVFSACTAVAAGAPWRPRVVVPVCSVHARWLLRVCTCVQCMHTQGRCARVFSACTPRVVVPVCSVHARWLLRVCTCVQCMHTQGRCARVFSACTVVAAGVHVCSVHAHPGSLCPCVQCVHTQGRCARVFSACTVVAAGVHVCSVRARWLLREHPGVPGSLCTCVQSVHGGYCGSTLVSQGRCDRVFSTCTAVTAGAPWCPRVVVPVCSVRARWLLREHPGVPGSL
ncbi:hypothetical protein NDU88_005927 [Pleurodeles waltl]|uniref:Uncharacterized protein n=1 Tax=Pleurodeles waltl TaxID=8319 RepID=A0AAV7L5Z8_PLEWA|nr:hypothetical protein NDU88_005927 [Pleurodeles waltl]